MDTNKDYINMIKKESIINSISYIDDMISSIGKDDLNLVFLVINQTEKILCLYDYNDENVLYLIVHLMEYVNDNGMLSYLFYPYHNVADSRSELILSEKPNVISAPNQNFINGYFEYWAKVKDDFYKELDELNNEPSVQKNNHSFYVNTDTKTFS